ncbi:MAG: hypothetical protein ABIP17_11880 [Ilumatobacteraceae bacterium]
MRPPDHRDSPDRGNWERTPKPQDSLVVNMEQNFKFWPGARCEPPMERRFRVKRRTTSVEYYCRVKGSWRRVKSQMEGEVLWEREGALTVFSELELPVFHPG